MSDESQPDGAASGKFAEQREVSLLDQIADATGIRQEDDGYDVTRRGIRELLGLITDRGEVPERLQSAVVDTFIEEIDQKIGAQLDEILHHADFQDLESAWTGLKHVVDNTNFREPVRVHILNASKQDLMDDFTDSPEIPMSGLYSIVYSGDFGVFGGEPYGAIMGNYDFDTSTPDMELLSNIASVSAMSHAPFIAAASPKFFPAMGEDFSGLGKLKDLDSIFDGDTHTKWQSFREKEDSRYVGLTLPRFLLRTPYDPANNPVKGFVYEENLHGKHSNYLWGNTSFAFASRLTDSFARYRWCVNIIGPEGGGMVEDLKMHTFESLGETATKIPTEVLVTDRKEFELSEQGFIPLVFEKGTDRAAFFSANSAHQPAVYPKTEEGMAALTNDKLGSRLPYMFITTRLAHYIKVLQRQKIGSSIERGDLERQLNEWIRQYVSDSDNPPAGIRASHPLRKAKITVSDVAGDPGWYRMEVKLRPHLKYEGAYFDLSLVGKLEE